VPDDTIIIRDATPDDRPAVERLVAALQDDGRRYDPALATGDHVTEGGAVNFVYAYATEDQGLALVAERDGKVVGYVGCGLDVDDGLWTDPAYARSVELQEMFVEPEARRLGIGRQLVAAVEAHARKLGVPRVLVTANASNPESCGLYRAAGFHDHKIIFEKRLDDS